MTVLAGTPLEAIQQAAAAAGSLPAGPWGTRILCHWRQPGHQCRWDRVIRYGMAREMVLGIEVVLPDGTRRNQPQQDDQEQRKV